MQTKKKHSDQACWHRILRLEDISAASTLRNICYRSQQEKYSTDATLAKTRTCAKTTPCDLGRVGPMTLIGNPEWGTANETRTRKNKRQTHKKKEQQIHAKRSENNTYQVYRRIDTAPSNIATTTITTTRHLTRLSRNADRTNTATNSKPLKVKSRHRRYSYDDD